MTIQSEQVLEEGLIKTLVSMNYEPVQIADEAALEANFRKQLEKAKSWKKGLMQQLFV